MSWQEELRRLDAELAAGTISSSEHRRRREDILAEVSGAPLVSSFSPAASAPDSTTSAAGKASEKPAPENPTTGSTDHGTEPSGEESGWRTTNPAQASDTPNTEAASASSSTTSAASSATSRPRPSAAALLATTKPTTAPSPADERPTELIHFPGRSRPTPVGTPEGTSDDEPPRRTALTWVAISGAVFLALGGVIGGAWWLGQDRSEPASAVAGVAADNMAPTPPQLADRLPALPGEQSPNNSTMSVAHGEKLKLYSGETAEYFTAHGVTEVIVRGSLDGSTSYLLLVLRAGSPEEAEAVADHLYQTTLATKTEHSEGPIRTASGMFEDIEVSGAWYSSNEYAVALVVTQPPEGRDGTLPDRLRRAMEPVKKVLPVR